MTTQTAPYIPVEITPTHLTESELKKWHDEQLSIANHQQQAKQKMLQALPDMVELAMMDCGGSYVIATMLLNIYNRYAWRFDLIDLRNLSHDNWQKAMDILSYQAYPCPDKDIHKYIENGEQIMQTLWNRYQHTDSYIQK